ncbi:hypothetical protein [Variovorax sp. PBL-H6]|uniref:hypothetical protein n=1 Tax=Variovorax sp. PBL-H6 TaxID=434009 RepID=UPI0013A5793F|nr:hypothetical protein [Variovorax sp. PBL-H6]
MAVLNEHQSRLLRKMLQLIEQFRQGKLEYYDFVGALEGTLDAGEFRDQGLVKRWYDLWTPLESMRAQQGNDVSARDVERYVSDMEAYLKNVLEGG